MNFSGLDDLQLLRLTQEGSEKAFAEIYTRYWKKIYSIAFTFLKSKEAAQDSVQEVFLKLWHNRHNLAHVQAFKPYLFVSARNLIISTLRNNVLLVDLSPGQDVLEQTFLPDRQLSYKESVKLLQQAIEQLPLQQQRAYKLSRNDGLRYDDIAKEMGISPLTVRTHITKALAFIRKYLTENSVSSIVLLLILLGKKD